MDGENRQLEGENTYRNNADNSDESPNNLAEGNEESEQAYKNLNYIYKKK